MEHGIWLAAVTFCARAHAGQYRKDGVTPYAAHPFRVAMVVRHVFGCDDGVALAAALLHDVIEDTGIDYDDLAESFGEEVARCVAALTKQRHLPEAEREAEYDQRLALADWRARLVKLADVYDNLIDARQGRGGDAGRAEERARRAVALARGDREAAVLRGIEAVEGLLGAR